MAALRRSIHGDICWSLIFMPLCKFFFSGIKAQRKLLSEEPLFQTTYGTSPYVKDYVNYEKCVFISVYYWILPKKRRLFQCPKYLILYYSGFLVLNADCLNDVVKADEMYSRQDCFLPELILKGSYLFCCFCIPYRGFGKEKYTNKTGVTTEDFILWTCFFPCVYFNTL